MRPVLLSDVCATARVLFEVAATERHRLCAQIVQQADWADRYSRRLKKAHPLWGNGTLLAAAMQWPIAVEPTFDDEDYCRCFEQVLQQLRKRRCNRDL